MDKDGPAVRKRSLFLGSLSHKCTEHDLRELFAPYGEIEEIVIKNRNDFNHSLTYGFVNFALCKSALLARRDLNGIRIHNEPLRIGWATTSVGVTNKVSKSTTRKIRTCQLHFSYISEQAQSLVTDESLRRTFSEYGDVLTVSIVQSKNITKGAYQRQSGHGFIHFSASIRGIESAFNAVKNTSKQTIHGVVFDCELSHQIKYFLIKHGVLQQDPKTGEEVFLKDKLQEVRNSMNATNNSSISSTDGHDDDEPLWNDDTTTEDDGLTAPESRGGGIPLAYSPIQHQGTTNNSHVTQQQQHQHQRHSNNNQPVTMHHARNHDQIHQASSRAHSFAANQRLTASQRSLPVQASQGYHIQQPPQLLVHQHWPQPRYQQHHMTQYSYHFEEGELSPYSRQSGQYHHGHFPPPPPPPPPPGYHDQERFYSQHSTPHGSPPPPAVIHQPSVGYERLSPLSLLSPGGALYNGWAVMSFSPPPPQQQQQQQQHHGSPRFYHNNTDNGSRHHMVSPPSPPPPMMQQFQHQRQLQAYQAQQIPSIPSRSPPPPPLSTQYYITHQQQQQHQSQPLTQLQQPVGVSMYPSSRRYTPPFDSNSVTSTSPLPASSTPSATSRSFSTSNDTTDTLSPAAVPSRTMLIGVKSTSGKTDGDVSVAVEEEEKEGCDTVDNLAEKLDELTTTTDHMASS